MLNGCEKSKYISMKLKIRGKMRLFMDCNVCTNKYAKIIKRGMDHFPASTQLKQQRANMDSN